MRNLQACVTRWARLTRRPNDTAHDMTHDEPTTVEHDTRRGTRRPRQSARRGQRQAGGRSQPRRLVGARLAADGHSDTPRHHDDSHVARVVDLVGVSRVDVMGRVRGPKHASAIFRGSSSSGGRSERRLACSRTGSGMTARPDWHAGRVFLNNRYLDATLGRFISVDPIVATTHDAYGYGHNSPVTFGDPSGLCAEDNGGAREACAGARRASEKQAAGQGALDLLRHKNDKDCQLDCQVAKGVFAGIDGAHRGTLKSVDGDWKQQDLLDAASGSENVLAVLLAMGLSVDLARTIAGITRNIASAIVDSGLSYGDLDHDLNGWDRNKGTIFSAVTMIASFAALAGCLVCGIGAAVLSTYSAVKTCTGEGSGLSCGIAIGSAALSWAGAGLASGGSAFATTGGLLTRAGNGLAEGGLLARFAGTQLGAAGNGLVRSGASLVVASDAVGSFGLAYDFGGLAIGLSDYGPAKPSL
jgi:RHS repeat-associated protein